MRAGRLAVAAVLAVLGAAVAGCGGDDDDGGASSPERTAPPLIGFLSASASPASVDALVDALAARGYRDGKTMQLDLRTTDDEAELPGIAQRFVDDGVDLIVAGGTRAVEAAKAATATIPIVMTNSGDPVGTGLVADLARPGGNITGLTQSSPRLAPKRLEVLKEAFPGLTTVAVLFNPDHPTTMLAVEELEAAAPGLGVTLLVTPITDEAALDGTPADLRARGAGAVVVLRDPFTIGAAPKVIAALEAARLPAMYETKNFLDDGGLMLYGPDLADLYRRAGDYVEKILGGADPGSLPIGQPTSFELLISTGAEARLGVRIAEPVRQRAELVD